MTDTNNEVTLTYMDILVIREVLHNNRDITDEDVVVATVNTALNSSRTYLHETIDYIQEAVDLPDVLDRFAQVIAELSKA